MDTTCNTHTANDAQPRRTRARRIQHPRIRPEDDTDAVYERVATTAKQLAKLDESKRLLDPPDLATTYLEAMLADEKKDALLEKAFGKKLGGDGGEKRDRAGSVLAKYAPAAAAAPEEDEVMADADGAEALDSDEE